MDIVILALSFLISLTLTLILYSRLIPQFKKLKMHQSISEYALKEFKEKEITPTLGGTVFVTVTTGVSLVLTKFDVFNFNYVLVLLTFIGYSLIGFLDDYKIIRDGKNDGLSPKIKLLLQLVLAIIFTWVYLNNAPGTLKVPFIDDPLNLGIFYSLLVIFMFVGSSNAVNLTDGMDGLSSGTSIIALIPFTIFALQQSQLSLAIFFFSLLGSLLGYLYFNRKPAKIYMGDCGSLALGGMFAASALVLKKELLLIVIGGVFVIETLSVIIQITSVKLFKKRIFPYTPIHYSFTIKGIREEATVILFYAVGIVFAILGVIFG